MLERAEAAATTAESLANCARLHLLLLRRIPRAPPRQLSFRRRRRATWPTRNPVAPTEESARPRAYSAPASRFRPPVPFAERVIRSTDRRGVGLTGMPDAGSARLPRAPAGARGLPPYASSRAGGNPGAEGEMRMRSIGNAAALCLLAALGGCNYVALLRPSVLKQLNPRVVDLVNYLPRVDDQNEAIIARLFAHGGLSRAERGPDGVYRQRVRIPPGEYIWQPSIIVLPPGGGELELDFSN